MIPSLGVAKLQALYRDESLTPEEVLAHVQQRIAETRSANIWISTFDEHHLLAQLSLARSKLAAGNPQPLFGIPFAVKDNIDVNGLPTTAGAPSYAYEPDADATVVARLRDAGAIVMGKTNMDQFATGLVGTRSPYGEVPCHFDERYISGGSSSGSAVAVANGSVSFALGTDTAGSGRVPAALNNIIGLKPTRGTLSTRGVVPACRSLDCVSVFSNTAADAARILEIARFCDPLDPFSRPHVLRQATAEPARLGILRDDERRFFGDDEAARLYRETIERALATGLEVAEVDYRPFAESASLLYEGGWLAERHLAVGEFLRGEHDDLDGVVKSIILQGATISAQQVFEGIYRLAELRRATERRWREVDALLLPTTGTTFTIEAVRKEPLSLNSQLGHYTNFVNLLDLAAVAVPAGFRSDGLPLGVSLVAPAHSDEFLLELAGRLHHSLDDRLPAPPKARSATPSGEIEMTVVGAHLSGCALNHQLVELGGHLLRSCHTATGYRLYRLFGSEVPKPGLVRDPKFVGPGIEAEVWSLPKAAWADFSAQIPAPLGIGKVTLSDNSSVPGFICEPSALIDAEEITHFGGWRAYLASRPQESS